MSSYFCSDESSSDSWSNEKSPDFKCFINGSFITDYSEREACKKFKGTELPKRGRVGWFESLVFGKNKFSYDNEIVLTEYNTVETAHGYYEDLRETMGDLFTESKSVSVTFLDHSVDILFWRINFDGYEDPKIWRPVLITSFADIRPSDFERIIKACEVKLL